jgi:hypothetical protein
MTTEPQITDLYVEYLFLKRETKQFREDLETLRKIMNYLPKDQLIELIADVLAIKELIGERLEKDFSKIAIL